MLQHLSNFAVAIALAAYVLALAVGVTVLAIARTPRIARQLDRDFAILDDADHAARRPSVGGVMSPGDVAPPTRFRGATQ
jgi:hypothetical protein